MANATSNELQELYVAYFGRAADPAGLDYWASAGTSKAAFAAHMHAQAEFQDAYGTSSTENQVNQIYRNLFDREADAAGLSYWTSQINNGVLALAEIANHLIFNVRSTGGNADDLAALNNRRDAAVAYTAEVKASTSAMVAYQPLSTSPFSAGENFEEAKNYMLGIDKDTAHTAAGVTASVDVIEANGTPAAKSSFSLTDNVDNLTGGDGNDTFTGTKGQIDGDTFNGGRGDDTLSITVDGSVAANGDNNATFTSSLIETISVRALGDTTLDFGDVSGTTGITVNRSSAALTIENITEIDPITLDREDDNQNHTFTYRASVIGGQSDSVTLNIINSANAGTINVAGIETINLVSTSNPTNDANELTLAETGTDIGTTLSTETLNISGTGDLELTDTLSLTITNSASADVEILDASAATSITHTGSGELDVTLGVADVTVTAANATGDLVVTAGVAGDLTLTGGAGADTFEMNSSLVYTNASNHDVIDGGAGIDTLQLTSSATTVTSVTDGDINVTNVEQIEINALTAADALDFDVFVAPASFTTAIITSLANGSEVTLTDVQASTYTIRNATAGNAADDLASAVIDLKDSSGTADTITINLANRQLGTTNNQEAFTLATLTAAGVEIATINATKTSSEGTAEDITVTAFNAVDLESLTLTGDADLVITNQLDDECVTVNAGAYTGALDLLHGTNALTYTGGTGEDTIRFAADDLSTTDTITGGAGDDTLIAVLDSGTITPTISGVETVRVTLNGGNLNASSITGATSLEIAAGEAGNTGNVSNLATTITEVTQLADAATVRFGYASGTAGTLTYNFTDTTAGNITNTATTIDNVANLTIAGGDGVAANTTAVDLGSLTAAALTSLTVTSGADANDAIDLGVLDADDIINITTVSDEGALTIGTIGGNALVDADDLATISVTGTGAGLTSIAAIGGTTSADALTSFTINMSGGAEAHLEDIDANDASVDTFDIDLTGNYVSSTLGTFTADSIADFDIDTGADGTSLIITAFDIQETLGTVDITTAEDFQIVGEMDVATSVGDINITASDSFDGNLDAIWIDEATSIGNITLTANANPADGTGIDLGEIDDATTIGNITITANDNVSFDGADAATTIGNITVAVDAGATADLDGDAGNQTFGAASSTIGNITASGGGTFQILIGAATTLGDVDLSGMTSGSTSVVTLNNNTTTGITATLGAGADTFVGTGGADNITTSTGIDNITAGSGDDVIDLAEAVGSRSVDVIVYGTIAASGNDVITGFTGAAGGDTIDVQALGGTGTANDVAANANAAACTDNDAYVFADGDDGTGADSTTSQIADYTDMTDVAEFLEAGINIAADDVFVAVINDLVNDKAYLYSVADADSNTTIAAGEVTLHGTITVDTADAVLVAANLVV